MSSGWCPFVDDTEPSENCWAGNKGLGAVVLHIGQGSYQAIRDEFTPGKQKSAHFTIARNGRIAQHVSIFDRAWANGLTFLSTGLWRDPEGATVRPPWPGLNPPLNPNWYTISIEHEGTSGDPQTPAMEASRTKLLRWIASETGLVYRAGDTLIGHCHISPVNRKHCPGPSFDYARIAQAANMPDQPRPSTQPSYTRAYRVKAGATATIRQAWWRSPDNIVTTLPAGTIVAVDLIHVGEAVEGSDEWLHLADGRGFGHLGAFERVGA